MQVLSCNPCAFTRTGPGVADAIGLACWLHPNVLSSLLGVPSSGPGGRWLLPVLIFHQHKTPVDSSRMVSRV